MIISRDFRRRRVGFSNAAARCAVIAGAFALSACGIFGDDKVPPPCPSISVLKETANLTQFVDGPGRDLIDVVVEGQIANAGGSCEYDVDDDTGAGTLSVEMMISLQLNRGPANQTRKADVGYFVAIADKQRNILNKQTFRGVVEFPGNRNRLEWTDEPVYLNIPLKAKQTGRDFLIFVGLDLTEDQIKFNRQKIRDGQSRPAAGG